MQCMRTAHMARTKMRVFLLIVGCWALSSTFAQAAPEDSAGLDVSFLSSWLDVDAGEAAQLAARGTTAAAARREMLASAASANGFGRQALPGAYPTPPPPPKNTPTGPEVTFDALLGGTNVRSFDANRQAAYRFLVGGQIRLAGGTSPTISTLSIEAAGRGAVLVSTRVVLPGNGQTAAAQKLVARLKVFPGPSAPWLDGAFRGSSVDSVVSSVACTDDLCETCPLANKARCSNCVDFTDPTTTALSVYLTSTGQCKPCSLANCATCNPAGACIRCKPDFALDAGRCQRVCADEVLCTNCDSRSDTFCDACRSRLGGATIYRTNKGQCKRCIVANCDFCSASGTCSVCRAGFARNNRDGCQRCQANCAVCSSLTKCGTCVRGFGRNAVGACRRR